MEASIKSAVRVSVVIPCRNEAATIEALVRSLLKNTGEDCEIIVADGMSDDGTREILGVLASDEPRVTVLDNTKMNTAGGLNTAIRSARGEYIVRMDAHTRYADDYVARSIETLEATGADNVGGPQLAESGNGYIGRAIAFACHSPAAVGGSRIHDPDFEGPTDSVIYGCWRRSLFSRIGYFDEELVRNQDGEHNRRLTRSGGSIWQTPRIRSWYSPRSRVSSVARQYAQYGYWKAREIQKSGRVESPRHIIPGAFVLLFPLLAVSSIFYRAAAAALLAVSASYLLVTFASALHLCVARGRWRYLPVLPLVFSAMQTGYGYGFVRGMVDFWLLKRPGRADFMRLTR